MTRWCRRLLGIGLLLWASAAAWAQAPVLRIGWDEFAPYQMQVGSRLQGIDIELATAVLERAGYKPQFVRAPWLRQLMSLQDGTLDLAMSASQTSERAVYAVWTSAYRHERAALLALANRQPAEPVHSLRQLIGHPGLRIGLVRGTSYPGELEAVMQEPGFARLLVPIRANAQSLSMLRGGSIDFLIDDPVALQYQAQAVAGPAVAVVYEFFSSPSYLMLARKSLLKHPQLLEELNASLAAMRRDGSLRALLNHYGGEASGKP